MSDIPVPCAAYREALELLASGSFGASEPESSRAKQHAETCPACRAFLADRRELWAGVKRGSEPLQAADTAHALVLVKKRIEREPREVKEVDAVPLDIGRREGRGRGFWIGGAAVAGLGVLAAAAWFADPRPRQEAPNSVPPTIPMASVPPGSSSKTPDVTPPRPPLDIISGATVKDLKIELLLQPDAKGAPRAATIRLENIGAHPVQVAAFYPLGANYELELRRPGEKNPEFVKPAPRALRKTGESATGTPASTVLEAAKGAVELQPREAYELELDVRELMQAPGEYHLSAHYLGFDQPGAATGAGAMLRSAECTATVKL